MIEKKANMNAANPQNIEEALLTLQIFASYEKNSFAVDSKENIVTISRKHPKFLFFIFYLVIFALPFIQVHDNLIILSPLLLVYFFFVLLLIWNLTRITNVITIDRNTNFIKICNSDILGKLFHPKKLIQFSDIEAFEPEFSSGRFGNAGKNIIYLKNIKGKKYPLLQIQSEGTGLINGRLLASCLELLCK